MQNQFPTAEISSSPFAFGWNLESSNPEVEPATDPPDNQGGGGTGGTTTTTPTPEEDDTTTTEGGS